MIQPLLYFPRIVSALCLAVVFTTLPIQKSSAQTFRVRAKPSPYGGISKPVTLFYEGDGALMVQPEEAPQHYAFFLLNEFPWQVTDEGLVFGSGFDANGNGYYFRSSQYDLSDNANNRQSITGVVLYEMNTLGDVVGANSAGGYDYFFPQNSCQPCVWKKGGNLLWLSVPVAVDEDLTLKQTGSDSHDPARESDDFDETHHLFVAGAIGYHLDDDGTVYGVGVSGYYISRILVNSVLRYNLLFDTNSSKVIKTENGFFWPGGNPGQLSLGSKKTKDLVTLTTDSPHYNGIGIPDRYSPIDLPEEQDYLHLVRNLERGIDALQGRGVWNTQIRTVEKVCNGHLLTKESIVTDGQEMGFFYKFDGHPVSDQIAAFNREGWAVNYKNQSGLFLQAGAESPSHLISKVSVTQPVMNERHILISDVNGVISERSSPQITGRVFSQDGTHGTAVLLQENTSSGNYDLFDLNQVADVPVGWKLVKATDINNKGVITAIVYNPQTGESKGAILFPVDITSKPAINKPWVPTVWGRAGADLPFPDQIINGEDGFITYPTEEAAAVAEKKAIAEALVIYHKNARDQNGQIGSGFKIDFKIADGTMENVSWAQVTTAQTPENPPVMQEANTAWGKLENVNQGGLYRYDLSCLGSTTGTQVWLPTAGPDISAYWESETNYFKTTWGPAYQTKLANRALFVSLMKPELAASTRQIMRINDIRKLGPNLDWENRTAIRGNKTPSGLANIFPEGFTAGDRARFTMHGIVIDFAKRNNMMYALIGRAMGLDVITLKNAPDVKDKVNKLLGNSNDVGTPDSPAALESYEAGFDLFNGVSLQQVMTTHGLKMQEPSGRAAKEWPSTETTTDGLTRSAAALLQALIQ